LRVGVLTSVFPRFAGDLAGHFVLATCRALRQRGLEVRVLAPHVSGTATRETVDGVPVERFRYLWPESLQRVSYDSGTMANLRASWRARLGLPFLAAAFWARARALAGGCDLLHAHWIPAGLVALALGPWRRRPVVVTVWGSDLALLRVPALGGMARRLLTRAARVVAVSETMARALVALGLPAERVCVVLTAIDPPAAPAEGKEELRRALGLPAAHTLALFLGRLSPVKGPDVLLEAVGRLAARHPEATFVFAGDGQLRGPLQEAARRLGVERQVRFVGQVPREDVPAYLTACDLLALPSRSEGLPHAVLEAMAFGLPVVASAVGGVPEVVQDGVTGALVPPEDPAALADALSPLLAEPDRRQRYAEAARRAFAAREHTWPRVARQLDEIYRALLAR
jgi:glycosyltransferase involved in cell wall biosynthesis